MSQFQFDQEIVSAIRLDSSLSTNVGNSSRRHRTIGQHGARILNDSSKSSKLFVATNALSASSGALNRSKSDTRLNSSNQLRRNRSKTPTRTFGSRLDTSSNSNSTSGNCTSNSSGLGDRFIPNRSATDLDFAHHSLMNSSSSNDGASCEAEQLRKQKMSEILDLDSSRILSFKNKAPQADEGHMNDLKILYSTGKPKVAASSKTRQVSTKPENILDVPDFLDDFYLHLLDWSCNNHFAVALTSSLFLWNAADGSVEELFAGENDNEAITSVRWVQEGSFLAVADNEGDLELWDVPQKKVLRRMTGHSGRVATMDWNQHILASGDRSGRVHLHDVRVPDHHVFTLNHHVQEVCGMAWSSDGNFLATGSNDNSVAVWDYRNFGNVGTEQTSPLYSFNEHQAAVKAVSWCPWQPKVLATGGGTGDRTIKFWNVNSGSSLQSVNCGSQVSSIIWNSEYKELVSGHGFSHNQLTIWKYPAMTKVADLKGHSSRILKVVGSPDGTTVASAAADETIRVWKIWPKEMKKAAAAKSLNGKEKNAASLFSQRTIR